ncbi:hypothetical protein AALP_AA4G068400 [Arabis alpina]|uniref:RRM domain-containing protein n=1 Tax=Arabis alpina TaxID=50452 RepID=A0A087H1M6_ARAAL|nr:hypothetical protein AALP_AA4G068400 [Arabis alpina]
MAWPFSSIFSNTASSSSEVALTREEFNAFHKIDRTLFTRLVYNLNRDMNQSIQVIGFLFLLEQNHYAPNLIVSLVSFPDAFINAVANESVVCLSFLYNKDFFFSMFSGANNNYDQSIIPLIICITRGRLSLSVINQNRETLLAGLRKNMSDVCARAFEDLCARAERLNKEKKMALEREKAIEELKKIRLNVPQATISRSCGQQATTKRPNVQQVWVPTAPPTVRKESNKTEEVVEKTAEEKEIELDDRTVFLTFSKGYPISEEQVRVYFTRKFGEVIEAVEMQEVEDSEQPLFARMVLKMRYVSKMEEIVCGRNRNKYTIDGKHVWARKYVRKNLSSAASPSCSHT